jgi:hypothetical protein
MDNNTHPIDVKLCPPRQPADAGGGQSTNRRMCVAALLAATLRGWMNASRRTPTLQSRSVEAEGVGSTVAGGTKRDGS